MEENVDMYPSEYNERNKVIRPKVFVVGDKVNVFLEESNMWVTGVVDIVDSLSNYYQVLLDDGKHGDFFDYEMKLILDL